jgi:hypothetical protein
MSATHHPSHSTPVTIIETVLIGSWVHLYGCPQDGWWLYWSDGVANDWTEHYTELSHALLHVASRSTAVNTTTAGRLLAVPILVLLLIRGSGGGHEIQSTGSSGLEVKVSDQLLAIGVLVRS